MSDAFSELMDAKTEACGKEEYVLIKGRKVKGMVSEIGADEAFISGGIAQEGGFRVSIAQSSVAKQPNKHDAIECRGQKLEVMSCNDTNGVTFEIVAGDPSSEGS